MAAQFELRTEVIFGVGSSQQIGDVICRDGRKKVAVIVDAAIARVGSVAAALSALGGKCEVLKVYENKVAEPDYEYLESVRREFSGLEPDYVIGIGGGSTLDLSKGIAVLIKNPGRALEYRGFDLVKIPPVPIIAVPTTAGTGSEVTPNASFIDRNEERKLGINSPYIAPKIAVLDPQLIVSCPRGVTVSSGMDVLVHAIESYTSKTATPTSRVFSAIAFSLAFNSLGRTVEKPDDVDARADVLLGSHYAGMAIMLAGGGPAAGLSYPLGVIHRVPHGLAGAVFLPKVVASNVARGMLAYAPLYDLIDGVDKNLTNEEKNKAFARELASLAARIGVPDKLGGFGVTRDNVDRLVADTMKHMKGALDQNPIGFDEKEVREILYSMV